MSELSCDNKKGNVKIKVATYCSECSSVIEKFTIQNSLKAIGLSMIATYAKFLKNHPIFYIGILSLLFITFICSVYLILEHGYLWAFVGLIIPLPCFFLFSKTSEYKRKYLHD